jgi:putative flavoprotein involved in K+ transport
LPDTSIIIIGAGAAGLSAAGALRRQGLDPLVLDKDSRIGGTWARRYDRLHLHTIRGFSGLPHYPIPGHHPRYLPKDAFVQYLRDYASHFDLKIVAGCPARKVRRAGDGPLPDWEIESGCGTWRCRAVVIATGQYGIPAIPPWPGSDEYAGTLTHSVDYRSGRGYAGKRVLVVGAGNSGTEIAADLVEHGAAFVAISIRTPPPVVPRDPFGLPVQRTGILLSFLPPRLADRLGRLTARLVLGDLTRYGMRPATWWPYSAKSVPVIDVGFVRELKRGRIHVRPNIARLTRDGAVYGDGRAEPFDAVIAATGFNTGLDQLIDAPGLIDERGEPRYPSGQPTAQPGLYFIGYTHSLRGHLFEANRASRRLAKLVAAYLRQAERQPSLLEGTRR